MISFKARYPLNSGIYVFILGLLLTGTLQAQETLHNAKQLTIGVSIAIPPWVIAENHTGIELDILKEAFAIKGYQVTPSFLSFALSYSLFEADRLDGIMNVKINSVKNGFYSDPVVHFDNVAISLEDKNFPENIEVSFLENKSVVAFQKASLNLGDRFSQMVARNTRYQEIAQQHLQINLLMIREIDFIIMEKSIFGYYWQRALNDPELTFAKAKLNRPIRIHKLFEPTEYRFVFAREQVRNDFNAGLRHIKNNGQYAAIFQRYEHFTDLYSKTKKMR